MLFHYDLSILKQPNMMAIYNNDPTNIQKLNTILFFLYRMCRVGITAPAAAPVSC